MSKRKQMVRFHLSSKKTTGLDPRSTMDAVARQYIRTAQELTPLIKDKNMSPVEALILIATYADAMLVGATKEHTMTEEQIIKATNLLMYFWKLGLFAPGPTYPFTLEQTHNALNGNEAGNE